MKCVVTGEETQSKSNNIPLSITGRKLLVKIQEEHNKQISDLFVNKAKERAEDTENAMISDDFLRSLAPKVNKTQALRLLAKEEADIVNTKNKVLNSEVE